MKPPRPIESLIFTVREQKVILDADLAELYGVTTSRLNQAVKRNRQRFPADFIFQLTTAEIRDLRSQIATGSSQDVGSEDSDANRSQIVTGSFNRSQTVITSQKHRDPRLRPYAFTEHGALQAANVLRSARAVEMSVFVIRAFVKMREALLDTRELAKKLSELEKQLTGRLDTHEAAIVHVLQELMTLLNPPPPPPKPPKPRIGF